MINQFRISQDDRSANDRLGDFLLATVQYIPILSILVAIGFLIIFFLSQTGIVGNPTWQLLVVTGVILFIAAVHIPIFNLAKQKRGFFAYGLFALSMTLGGILFVLFWQGIAPLAIMIVWIPFLTLFGVRIRRIYFLAPLLLGLVASALLIGLDNGPLFDRLTNNNPAGLTALILLASTVLLFILTTIVSRILRFRTLQSRLVVSFIFIITVPILFITVISVLNAFTNSQNQFRDTLQAVSVLKQAQVDATINQSLAELSTLQQGSGQASLLYIVEHQGVSDQLNQMNNSLASIRIRDFMVSKENRYEEVLVLNMSGKVLLSSNPLDQGLDLSQQSFFIKGSTGYFVGLNKFPGQENAAHAAKLLLAGPFYALNGQDVRGVVVLVANGDEITRILEVTPGLADAETYLVDESLIPVTKTASQPSEIRSPAIINMIKNKNGEGSGRYDNYHGIPVLGYYRWYPDMQAAIIAEIPENNVFTKAFSTLVVSGLIGIFTIIIAIIAVISTSRTISRPVAALVNTAELFSGGRLESRAESDREDEIGILAKTFNAMADQLQAVIGNLEKRVAERTKDLERQTLRLRTAAEVARDAASVPKLEDLLERAVSLIRDRFDLYHTGIFLLDEKNEYAVLSASPTEAGHKMIENHHRLRVGEQGIVGTVAASGEPRIALDTGVDPVFFNNPLLPATRSEMALPFKSNEGVIGVLDIQSDQPEAFTQDDVAIMQVLADQLATAIERIRLLVRVETNLKELEKTASGYTERSWMNFDRYGHQADGYRYDNIKLEPVKNLSREARTALEIGKVFASEPSDKNSTIGQSVAIPIRLRGQTIGVVNIRFQHEQAQEKTLSMIEQIADRLATALENARLLENSMRSADKERVISEITSKIGSSVNIRNVLQTAVEELGRALPGSDVIIQFQRGREAQGQEK